ncbi:MAG: FAD-dependent oxidoreductase [Anaplasma sp.]
MECMDILSQKGLYSRASLKKLDRSFLKVVEQRSPELLAELIEARRRGYGDSEIIINLSYILEGFVAQLFHIEEEVTALNEELHEKSLVIYKCKRSFVHRHALKKYCNPERLDIAKITNGLSSLFNLPIAEYDFAKKVTLWLENPQKYESELDIAAQYASYVAHSGRKSLLFQVPSKIDYNKLVPTEKIQKCGIDLDVTKNPRERTGFNIAKLPSPEHALNEVHYCIICHKQKRDSCSVGMKDKSGCAKVSELGVQMGGCPLRVKISEMNFLSAQGLVISPLAVLTIDNPMCALTGHRICNDCTRACIYQKQQPVDIPYIETYVLNRVLDLTYGFEIYSLFTRWKPLSFTNVLPKKHTGKNILVAGLGPAGISLAHYLLNEGHNVVAVDGLKIEPLPERVSGVTRCNEKCDFALIRDVKGELFERLDHRTSYGFGGVSEYGITARWNKNYLTIARLLLERRENFAMYGGVLLGGTLGLNDVFALGFHHIALAIGAGAPRIPAIKNMLAKGVLTASSFLMSLHLGNAAHEDSITNLQIRLPAVVIGGGLTAVDVATELLAYYPVQVERFLSRYEVLVQRLGRDFVERTWSSEEQEISREFLDHARQIKQERAEASKEARPPRLLELLQKWGGVTIVYRGNLGSSTAYRVNSEELQNAMSEGVYFAENIQSEEIVLDKYNHAAGIIAKNAAGYEQYIAAKNVVIATGTHEGCSPLEEQNIDVQNCADNVLAGKNGTISVLGDLHPQYRGSVVNAIASAKNGYPAITEALKERAKCRNSTEFFREVRGSLLSRIVSITALTPDIIGLTVLSPLAARKFSPGQFYKLQNLRLADGPAFSMEGIAVTGAYVDRNNGTITVVILDVGGSSRLCKRLREGQLVSLMGPTGTPTEIPNNENVMLVGGGVGNAVLFSIGKALKYNSCKVLYFAGYRNLESVFKMHSVEEASDIAVWCCEAGEITPNRPADASYRGNVVSAVLEYHEQGLGQIQLQSIDRVIAVGSHGMMSAVSRMVDENLGSCFKRGIKVVASINSPMQCMMRGVCGQCIQRHVDPITKAQSFVYSCVNQDQPANCVDFQFLDGRLRQNSLLEKCTSLWVDHCMEKP